MLEQSTVPDFFQGEAGRPPTPRSTGWNFKSAWTTPFLSRSSRLTQTFRNWRLSRRDLAAGREETLRRFWQTTLHLLSFLNFDRERIRELFHHSVPAGSKAEASALAPPWNDLSLKKYLEQAGDHGIEKVDCWVTGLRFGDLYAA